MLPTINLFEYNNQNKENLQFLPEKEIDDDAESSHSDCFIIESRDSKSKFSEVKEQFLLSNVLPKSLPKDTDLFLVYEHRTVSVQLVASIHDLKNEEHIMISHLKYIYSMPKRHLYFLSACNIQNSAIQKNYRVMYISSSIKKPFALGFVCEMPSIHNYFRHLILLDDGTVTYTINGDRLHICLCQDFEKNVCSIESKLMQENFQQILFNKNPNQRQYQINNYIRVKKFDDKYHNAQIIDIDCTLIKVKFYERQAKTETWIHRNSLFIDDTDIAPIDLASPVILDNKRKYDEVSPKKSRPRTSSLSLRALSSYFYEVHVCSPCCVLTAEENFHPNSISQNPYTLPLACGWQYYNIDRYGVGQFKKKNSTRKATTKRAYHYLYRTPCGRSFYTLSEIEEYLLETDSKLTIKLFITDSATRPEPSIECNSQYILTDDIAQGKENVKISVYNDNNKDLPEPFVYVTETRSSLIFQNDTTDMTCCSCTDNCRDRMKCPCWLKTYKQAKLNRNEQIFNLQRQKLSDQQIISRFGYVYQRLKTPVWSGIYECNSKCSCHTKHCTNRLVQNSLYQQLQLFHTNTKGWALRVLHDVPDGSFINAYVGELITEEMAAKRDFKYLAVLDHKSHLNTNDNQKRKTPTKNDSKNVRILNAASRVQVKNCIRLSVDDQTDSEDEDNSQDEDDACFILDAKHYGSVSRFYNHSCKPNVHIQNVFINSHDPRFPVIALFACRNIRAGEEICWDYNYTVGCMPNVRIDCQCQASNCRGRLL